MVLHRRRSHDSISTMGLPKYDSGDYAMVASMMGQSMLLTLVNPMTIPGLMECIALIMLSLTKLGR